MRGRHSCILRILYSPSQGRSRAQPGCTWYATSALLAARTPPPRCPEQSYFGRCCRPEHPCRPHRALPAPGYVANSTWLQHPCLRVAHRTQLGCSCGNAGPRERSLSSLPVSWLAANAQLCRLCPGCAPSGFQGKGHAAAAPPPALPHGDVGRECHGCAPGVLAGIGRHRIEVRAGARRRRCKGRAVMLCRGRWLTLTDMHAYAHPLTHTRPH